MKSAPRGGPLPSTGPSRAGPAVSPPLAFTTRATRFDLYSQDPYMAFSAITLGLPALGGMVIPSSLGSPSKPAGGLLPGAGGCVPFIPHPPTEGHRKECRALAGGEREGWCTEDGWRPLSKDTGSAHSPRPAHRCLPFPTAFSPRPYSDPLLPQRCSCRNKP